MHLDPASGTRTPLRVTAICDAAYSHYGNSMIPYGVGRSFAEHDLAMVKPALLYADEVTLRSGNYFIEAQLASELTLWHMPQRALMRAVRLASNPDRERIVERLGAGAIQFPDHPDAEREMGLLNELRHDWLEQRGQALWREWDGYLQSIGRTLVPAIEADIEGIQPFELSLAIEAEVLRIEPHTDSARVEGVMPFDTMIGPEWLDEVGSDSWYETMVSIATCDHPLMLDTWAATLDRELLEIEGLVSTNLSRLDLATEIGMALLVDLPTVKNATIQEVLDIRKELQGPLVRFRAALVDATEEATSDQNELAELMRELRVAKIDPALEEMDELSREDKWIRAALSTVTDPKELVAPAGGLAVAAGVAGAFTPVGILAALAGFGAPVLQTWRQLQDTRSEVKANPFYFMHRLGASSKR